jgi:hypothetical protein
MREESLRLASTMCQPLENTLCEEDYYRVESTGAIVTINSSVPLIYFFCSKLPFDESVFVSITNGFLLLHIAKDFQAQISYVSHGSFFCLPDIINLYQDSLLIRNYVHASYTFPRAVLYRQFIQKEKFLSSRRQFVLRPAENYTPLAP